MLNVGRFDADPVRDIVTRSEDPYLRTDLDTIPFTNRLEQSISPTNVNLDRACVIRKDKSDAAATAAQFLLVPASEVCNSFKRDHFKIG